MPLILPGNVASATAGAYEVANSCRFNGDAYMHKSLSATATHADKCTFSIWVKPQVSDNRNTFVAAGVDGNNYMKVRLQDDKLAIYGNRSSSNDLHVVTNRVFRDPSAWYHIVLQIDTTQSTAENRVKFFVNGVQETSMSTTTYMAQNADCFLNGGVSSSKLFIGAFDTAADAGVSEQGEGYFAEVALIDGSILAPTEFGEYDEDSPTIWKPKDISGLTFGANGFYLDFEDSSNLGNDANGGTDLTESGLAAADQATDTPTNNFCTLNPLSQMNSTFSEGNNYVVTGGNNSDCYSTFGLTSGKWVWEVKHIGGDMAAGITIDTYINGASQTMGGNTTSIFSYLYYSAGGSSGSVNRFVYNSSNVYNIPSGFGDDTDDTIYQFLLDLDSGTKTFKIRRAGDAASEGSIDINSALLGGDHIFIGYSVQATWPATTHAFNFGGCPAFSISSGNADANGYGNFEYAVPSGYYALCTKNLAEFG